MGKGNTKKLTRLKAIYFFLKKNKNGSVSLKKIKSEETPEGATRLYLENGVRLESFFDSDTSETKTNECGEHLREFFYETNLIKNSHEKEMLAIEAVKKKEMNHALEKYKESLN